MLDANNHRGSFGEAYVRVLAYAAGLTVYDEDVDRDGVDLGIRIPAPGRGFSRAIEVQIKTTSVPRWRGAVLHFDGLDRRQFNRLAGGGFQVQRYLVVVTVPPDSERYADLFTKGLLLRNIAYFVSLADRRLLPEDTSGKVTVTVPAANVLTAASLRGLVERDPVSTR